jgi:hypothetical protein
VAAIGHLIDAPRLQRAGRQPLAAEGIVLQREIMADLLADTHLLGLARG